MTDPPEMVAWKAVLPVLRLTFCRQRDFANELIRRRASPGGQQAGLPHYGQIPMSMLIELERECRHALDLLPVAVREALERIDRGAYP